MPSIRQRGHIAARCDNGGQARQQHGVVSEAGGRADDASFVELHQSRPSQSYPRKTGNDWLALAR